MGGARVAAGVGSPPGAFVAIAISGVLDAALVKVGMGGSVFSGAAADATGGKRGKVAVGEGMPGRLHALNTSVKTRARTAVRFIDSLTFRDFIHIP